MTWLLENWYILLGILAVLVAAGFAIYKFAGLPTASQIEKIKEWLLYAVTEAEASLGGQTGILKLRMVYDMFVARFPMVAKVVSFETFSYWVDEALDKMKELLETNEAIKNVIEGE
jgi:hypothetical protein